MTDNKKIYKYGKKRADDKKRLNETVSLVKKTQPILNKLLGKTGISDIRIISNWADIVGNDLSKISEPKKITYKRGQKQGGILHISVVGAYATEMSYMEGVIVEKVNSFIGTSNVGEIRLIHDFVVVEKQSLEGKVEQLNTDCEKLDKMLCSIDDTELKNILERLGKHIIKEKQ